MIFVWCQVQQGCWCTCRAAATAAGSTCSAGDLRRTTAASCTRRRRASAARAAAAASSPTHPRPAARKRAKFSGKCSMNFLGSLFMPLAFKPHTPFQYYNCGQNRSQIAATSIGLISYLASGDFHHVFFGHPPVVAPSRTLSTRIKRRFLCCWVMRNCKNRTESFIKNAF